MGDGVTLAVVGAAIGLTAAWLTAGAATTMLYGVSPRDPLVFGTVPLLFALIGAAAAYLPARRATRIDPMIVMRAE